MEVSVYCVEGVFLNSNKHSETNVYSTGRGTRSSPLQVQSRTTTVQEFWIKKADDTEFKVTLYNQEVVAREGHHISMMIADSGSGEAGFAGYVNFDTETTGIFNSSVVARHFAQNALPCVVSFALFVIAAGIIWYKYEFILGLLTCGAGLFFATMIRNVHAFFINLAIIDLAKKTARLAKKESPFSKQQDEVEEEPEVAGW